MWPTHSTLESRPRSGHARLGLWALAALLVGGAGCRSHAPRASTLPADAPSVAPGINAEYLKPNLDVAQWIERFEREGREIFNLRLRIVAESGVKPGMAVADIGAGTGLFTFLFAEAVTPRGRVYAVDIVPEFLRHIEARAQATSTTNIRTVPCTERTVPLPTGTVDLAFVCDAYHHFEYPQATLAGIWDALRRHGRLVLVEFRREEGRSSDWILRHVRAGQEVFEAEIVRAGFKKIREANFLRDNYFVVFERDG